MKLVSSLLLIPVCVTIFAACKKSSITPSVDDSGKTPSSSSDFSIPVTKEQASFLNSLIKEGKVAGPLAFHKLCDSLKAVNAQSKTASANKAMDIDDDPASYVDGFDIGTNAVADYENVEASYDDRPDIKTLQARIQSTQTFAIRGNQLEVIVPYIYDCVPSPISGNNAIAATRTAGIPVQINPIGAYWGEVTQGAAWYINGATNPTPQESCAIEAYGTATEKRTQIFSLEGKIKISTEANAEVFKVGTEMEAGFTIQRAQNIYNQYEMHVNGQVTVSSELFRMGFIPFTTFQGTVWGSDRGILKNL